jgi:two-component system, OmpR family, response regulator PrrA
MQPRVLLVEDDDAVRTAVETGLGLHGFEVTGCGSAEDALDMLGTAPDLVVLDVGLPGMSGIELCGLLRARELDTPILVLSARDAVGERVNGLQAGADDYLVKPFDLDELAARLDALLRRARRAAAPSSLIQIGALSIDPDRRVVTALDRRLDLTRREFDLLLALATNRRVVLSRFRLLELVWGYDFDVDTNVVDVFVGQLRRKLSAAGLDDVISTVRGIGFVIDQA